jgi:hypothetical protein
MSRKNLTVILSRITLEGHFLQLGVILVLKMIPKELMVECRERSQGIMRKGKPVNRIAATVIIAIWILFAAIAVGFMLKY